MARSKIVLSRIMRRMKDLVKVQAVEEVEKRPVEATEEKAVARAQKERKMKLPVEEEEYSEYMPPIRTSAAKKPAPQIKESDIEQLQKKLEELSTATTQLSKKQKAIEMDEKLSRIENAVDKLQSKPGGGITIVTAAGEPVTTPVILEFPRVAEDLKSRGIITVGQKSVGDVRGIPAMLALPEAEKAKKISSEWEPTVSSTINIRYALIEPYAYVNIRWNEKTEEVIYTIIEPPLTKEEDATIKKLMEMIIDLLDINLMNVTEMGAVKKYLRDKINLLIEDYGFQLTKSEYDKINYYMERNFLGFGAIEPILQDAEIEDISCDGVGVPIFVFHRKYGSMKSNVQFSTEEELNQFITKLSQRCGKHISVADPLVDGALPDGSRLQATYSTGGDIATKGSTFTIRKFTKDPLTIVDLMNFGTVPATMAAYLWLAIEFRNSVLVAGGTATGKTSCLNTLCLFLHPETKIVSIEDTPELALPHEHWVAKISRTGYGSEVEDGRKRGEISMYDLLRAALRERPDEIIVGEVRGKEAYVLFQAMATGHAGMATIHAESTEAVINRLITAPISLSPGLLQHLNLILIMTNSRVKGVDVRRVKEVVEVLGIDMKSEKPITNQLFKWVASGDYYEFSSDRSFILNKIVEEKGIAERSVWEELQRRTAVLEWMKKEKIRYYKDVGRIVAIYYKSPEEILKRVFGGKA